MGVDSGMPEVCAMARQTFQINILGPAGPEEVSVGYLSELLGACRETAISRRLV